MHPLGNTSIRAKLSAVVGLALAVSIGVGLFALFQLNQFNNLGTKLTEYWLPELETASELKRAITEHWLLAERRTETTNFRQLAAITENLDRAAAEVEAAARTYGAIADDDDELRMLRGFETQWTFYTEVLDTVFRRLDSGDPSRGMQMFRTSVTPIFDAAAARLDGLLDLARAEGVRVAADAHATYDRFLLLTITVITFAGAFAGLAYLWVTRSISVPIRHVSDTMNRLTAGDDSVSITSDADRKDEIGDLLKAAKEYRESLLLSRRLTEKTMLERERLQAAVTNMPIGLSMFDADKALIICNERYEQMYKLPPELTKPGTPLHEMLGHRVQSGIYPGEKPDNYVQDLLARIERREPYADLIELRDGRSFNITVQPMASGGWVSVHEDVTARREVEARIAHMARHDALTDLPNRIFFRERLELALQGADDGENTAVLYLDLDRFKGVNDSLGHPVGDALLRLVGERLQSAVREEDSVARVGGDEFAIVQVGEDQPVGATALAERIIATLAEPYEIDGSQLVAGTSVGVAIAPMDGTDPDRLLKNADMALYRAKQDGRGIYRFFEREMDQRMQMRRRLEIDMRRALKLEEFEVYYQPQLNLERGEISGFEALLRWNHPERGQISPGDFIPLAEEIGLIVPLGEWVLRRACKHAAQWPEGVRLAVNLSAAQFKGTDLAKTVTDALNDADLPAHRLELEITESVLLSETGAVLNTLHALHSLGVRISMDDFGTGYSSLSYLRSFPFDKIKIDRSFVRDIAPTGNALAIVRAVTGLGTSLGMQTTAEGVETADQLMRVRQEGCTEVQGYLIGKPGPANEIPRVLRSRPWQEASAA